MICLEIWVKAAFEKIIWRDFWELSVCEWTGCVAYPRHAKFEQLFELKKNLK